MTIQTIHRSGRFLGSRFAFICIVLAVAAISQSALGASAPRSSSGKSGDDARNEANVYFNKGKQHQEEENYKLAEEQYRQAIEIDTKYAEAHSNLGYSLRKQGLYDEAVKSYKKAIQLNYRLAEAHEYLGEAYAELGKFDLAEKELKILRDLKSDEADELAEFIAKKKGS